MLDNIIRAKVNFNMIQFIMTISFSLLLNPLGTKVPI